MNKVSVVSIVVWTAAMGSAALLIYETHRPLAYSTGANAISEYAPVEPVVDTPEPVLELPMDTIVGSRRGAAEMQGADDLSIGHGVVTRPNPTVSHAISH
jgi:hypothetical protein